MLILWTLDWRIILLAYNDACRGENTRERAWEHICDRYGKAIPAESRNRPTETPLNEHMTDRSPYNVPQSPSLLTTQRLAMSLCKDCISGEPPCVFSTSTLS